MFNTKTLKTKGCCMYIFYFTIFDRNKRSKPSSRVHCSYGFYTWTRPVNRFALAYIKHRTVQADVRLNVSDFNKYTEKVNTITFYSLVFFFLTDFYLSSSWFWNRFNTKVKSGYLYFSVAMFIDYSMWILFVYLESIADSVLSVS